MKRCFEQISEVREDKEEEEVFALAKQLIDKLGTNNGKMDRLKDVSPTSHTSIVSPENLIAMLQPNEQERKCNVDQWFKKVRKVLMNFITKLADKHPSISTDMYSFAHFIQSIHPPIFLDRPFAQSQYELDDSVRCIALCDQQIRCFRQRHRHHGYLCTHHQHSIPFGVDPMYESKFLEETKNEMFELPLRLINYRGYFVYVDLLNNNVYHTEDIYCKKPEPRIIGKYSVTTNAETLEEIYTIPALDDMTLFTGTGILQDA